ncbi:ACT domain-containing protein [Aliikangiella sp. IMCC44653]
MNGETDLKKLIATMQPQLSDKSFVFCCIDLAQWEKVLLIKPIGFFQEEDGFTLIVEKQIAQQYQLEYSGEYKKITLQVYSSLQAVGLTAAVATQLAKFNISANVVAGYHHDHIFVPLGTENTAIDCLQQLSKSKQ